MLFLKGVLVYLPKGYKAKHLFSGLYTFCFRLCFNNRINRFMEEGGSGYSLTVLGSPTQLLIDPDLKETRFHPQ